MNETKTPIPTSVKRLLILVGLSSFLLLTLIRHRPSAHPLARSRAHFTRAWTACDGDAACCASRFSPPTRPHRVVSAKLSFGTRKLAWRMAVHPPARDIVSSSIARHGAWESSKTRAILRALSFPGQPAALVDIGANVGWFSLAAVHFGARVVAVEPFAENLALVAHSLCLAPSGVRENVTLLPTGLGATDGSRCEMWTDVRANRGNTHTVCDTAASAEWMGGNGYKKVGEVSMASFDALVEKGEVKFAEGERVAVKIDVEGFEYQALRGAKKFLDKVRPNVVWAEYIPKMISRAAESVGLSAEATTGSPAGFLAFMKERGYSERMTLFGKPHKVWGQQYEAVFVRG